jgi:hypothetical protein
VALTLAKTLRLLAAEKRAVFQRQSALVANLNKLLPSIGYRVVPLENEGGAAGRRTVHAGARSAALSVRPLGKPLVCPHCSRTFALPLHLGRHLSVMHKGVVTPSASVPAREERDAGARKARSRTGRPRGQAARTIVRKTARKAAKRRKA